MARSGMTVCSRGMAQLRDNFRRMNGFLLARLEVADSGDKLTAARFFQLRRVRRFQFLCAFELFVGFCGRERVVHGETGGAQILDELE